MAAFGRPAAIVDLETTGGSFDTDRITEIAFLRFDGTARFPVTTAWSIRSGRFRLLSAR
ncbi:hypothetical protein [Kingella potus]|uniref:hypothetical protein n=1 Tax=Kingella potus TaxID=265175 RepID=UPI0031401C36